MSDSARQKRLFLLVLIVFSLFFVVGYTSRLIKKNRMENEVHTWQARIAQAQQKGVALEAELAHVQSEAHVHEKAREVLGLVQPDDTLIVGIKRPLAEKTASSTVAAFTPTVPPTASVGELPTWQQWLNLFLPTAGTVAQPE